MQTETEEDKFAREMRRKQDGQTPAGYNSGANECGVSARPLLSTAGEIEEMFTYHSPTTEQAKQYETLRGAAKHLAHVIVANVPYSADRTAAIRKLRECVMTANAAIALRGVV